jgi:hypothetical protein
MTGPTVKGLAIGLVILAVGFGITQALWPPIRG